MRLLGSNTYQAFFLYQFPDSEQPSITFFRSRGTDIQRQHNSLFCRSIITLFQIYLHKIDFFGVVKVFLVSTDWLIFHWLGLFQHSADIQAYITLLFGLNSRRISSPEGQILKKGVSSRTISFPTLIYHRQRRLYNIRFFF